MDRIETETLRAEQAKQILSSPLWEQAFADTRAALLNSLASLDNLRDEHARDIHAMVKTLDKVKRVLETHVSTGKLAQKELEERKRFQIFRRQA